jgi:hypothetical protein
MVVCEYSLIQTILSDQKVRVAASLLAMHRCVLKLQQLKKESVKADYRLKFHLDVDFNMRINGRLRDGNLETDNSNVGHSEFKCS